ncbi:MAG: homocysteine S-methyltransferase family protein [Deltaproteobacteria bacterium]|nr:homocysteine S-methyltransferase family protein [Deltaproteobacteria bacterium]
MGTALLAAGLPTGALPEAWLRSRPGAVGAVHAGHAAAGARLLLSCTFNLAGPRLDEQGLGDEVEELAATALRVLRQAAPLARAAGAVGPTALVVPRGRRVADAELRERYRRPFRALAAAGADLLWAESQWDLAEARGALAEARAAGLPAVVTLGPALEAGRLALPEGPPLGEALRALASDGAAAVGLNCVLPGIDLAAEVEALGQLPVPLVVKPSAGLPGALLEPEPFAAWVAAAANAGAAWVGGCCGAGTGHLAALARALEG